MNGKRFLSALTTAAIALTSIFVPCAGAENEEALRLIDLDFEDYSFDVESDAGFSSMTDGVMVYPTKLDGDHGTSLATVFVGEALYSWQLGNAISEGMYHFGFEIQKPDFGAYTYIRLCNSVCKDGDDTANMSSNDGGVFETNPKVRIYNPGIGIAVYDLAERVTVDRKSAKGFDEISAALKNFKPSISGQFIGYSLNDKGEIAKLDTAYSAESEDGGCLIVDQNSSMQTYYYETKTFGYKTIVNSSTVIFAVPADDKLATAQDEDFALLPLNQFTDGDSYTVETYKFSEKEGFARYMVAKGDINQMFTRPSDMLMVAGMQKQIRGDEEVVDVLVGYSAGVKLELEIVPVYSIAASGIKEGDLIRYTRNARGQIVDTEMIYSYNKELTPPEWAPRTSSYTNGVNITHGYVDSITNDDVIRIRYEGSATVSEVGNFKNVSTIVVYDPDRVTDPVYVAGKEVLETADAPGAQGSMVFIRTRYGVMMWMAMYK